MYTLAKRLPSAALGSYQNDGRTDGQTHRQINKRQTSLDSELSKTSDFEEKIKIIYLKSGLGREVRDDLMGGGLRGVLPEKWSWKGGEG